MYELFDLKSYALSNGTTLLPSDGRSTCDDLAKHQSFDLRLSLSDPELS